MMERSKLFLWNLLIIVSLDFLFPVNAFCISAPMVSVSRTILFQSKKNNNLLEDAKELSSVKSKSRRKVLAATTLLATAVLSNQRVDAFDRTFPDELADSDNFQKVVTLGSRSNLQQRTTMAKEKDLARKENLTINSFRRDDLIPSITWGGALWFLSGSRSNPLATPIANVLYDEKDADWLKDRNAGLFAALPFEFLLLLGGVFVVLGLLTQFLLLQLAEGDSTVCFQLAGVSLIWGGFFEIGRLASGEKRVTRDEFDRRVQLNGEFEEFANNRILAGGNCHRSDIIAAFRRYHAKYRDTESTEYPLTDLEIEKLLRAWNQIENRGQAEMTSSGFYYGIQINKEADVFVSRL
jgi:hypothetical protein